MIVRMCVCVFVPRHWSWPWVCMRKVALWWRRNSTTTPCVTCCRQTSSSGTNTTLMTSSLMTSLNSLLLVLTADIMTVVFSPLMSVCLHWSGQHVWLCVTALRGQLRRPAAGHCVVLPCSGGTVVFRWRQDSPAEGRRVFPTVLWRAEREAAYDPGQSRVETPNYDIEIRH